MHYASSMRNNGACSLAGTTNYSESNDSAAAHLCVYIPLALTSADQFQNWSTGFETG